MKKTLTLLVLFLALGAFTIGPVAGCGGKEGDDTEENGDGGDGGEGEGEGEGDSTS